jgi:hypothetical protein
LNHNARLGSDAGEWSIVAAGASTETNDSKPSAKARSMTVIEPCTRSPSALITIFSDDHVEKRSPYVERRRVLRTADFLDGSELAGNNHW